MGIAIYLLNGMILQVLITYNRFLSHHIVPYDESCRSTPVMPEFKAPAVEGPRSVWSRCGAVVVPPRQPPGMLKTS